MIVFSLVLQGTALASPSHSVSRASRAAPALPPCPGCSYPYWGANDSLMNTAVNNNHAQWPQHQSNWCGVSNIIAINWYDQMKVFGTNVDPVWKTQESIASLLNTNSAISPWGQASGQVGHPAFKADIAGDGGTDPRSIAWATWTVTPNNFFFHNWIYRTSNYTATADFAADFGPAHGLNDPISVTIDRGQRSFVVSGVYASSDPSAGGSVLAAIITWDSSVGEPGSLGHQPTREYAWSVDDWLNYISQNGHYLWRVPYDTSHYDPTFWDPEPSTTPGNYYNPSSTLPAHWNGYYVTIEQDLVTRCNASPDIAYVETGAEAPHNGASYCP